MIFSTVYVSTMTTPLDQAGRDELLTRSQANNARHDITGLLLYRDGQVMQILEGPRSHVEDLYHRISNDPRHHSIVRVWTSTAERRRFPTWSMGFDDLNAGVSSASAHTPDATPDMVSAEDELLHALDVRLAAADGDYRTASAAQQEVIATRAQVLRRSLVSGDRLVTALAVILHGHNPQQAVGDKGLPIVDCGQCRTSDAQAVQGNYPCSTASNALWALNAVLR